MFLSCACVAPEIFNGYFGFQNELDCHLTLIELTALSKHNRGATIDCAERRRRNSDSAVYFNAKEELPFLRLQCLETELTNLRKRITLVEVKTENLGSYSSEEKETASLGTPDEEFDFKSWDLKKMEKDTKKMEGSEGGEIKPTAKLMAREKMDFVQKYLENVQETYSVTTEASDSGLGTRTAVSEGETEDVEDSIRLCLKDLREESIEELDRRLRVDVVGFQRFIQFFGLKGVLMSVHPINMKNIARIFPNTPVDLVRQCFDALQMYDLIDLLEKAVKLMSLRPFLSPEEVETLRTDNLPTKSHKNVVVLVVNDSSNKNLSSKIERFFKELNSQNEVTVVQSSCSKLKGSILNKFKSLKKREISLREEKKRLWSEVQSTRNLQSRDLITSQLFQVNNDAARLEEEMESWIPAAEELLKETQQAKTIITSTLDLWIQNQEKFTAVFLFFIIGKTESIYDYDVLAECVASKLTSLPHHTKIVVGFPKSIIVDIPETLSFGFRRTPMRYSVYDAMIEIFIKRHHKLDLVSMLRELKRTHLDINSVLYEDPVHSDLSTLAMLEKKREQEPERS
ncbi:uncharacterized protein LOC111342096 [Stylophora pistillata]|uniref:uncharacterized protein LOC111342096 n=1 Tax=Stylophora pistillata TaxID=50429 RepID=UPI000C04C5D8|nr:uncharacterized protein LOC111342096 [Stylophora pistillata]